MECDKQYKNSYEIESRTRVKQKISNELELKANLNSPTFTGTVNGITSNMVGLGNVNNTSDVAKPVSTAQAASIATRALLAGSSTQTFQVANATNSNHAVSLAQLNAAITSGPNPVALSIIFGS